MNLELRKKFIQNSLLNPSTEKPKKKLGSRISLRPSRSIKSIKSIKPLNLKAQTSARTIKETLNE